MEPLWELLVELAGAGRLQTARSPEGYCFKAIRSRAAERREKLSTEERKLEDERLRKELEHTRGYLHGPPEDRPYHEQELRELSAEDLLWEPPTESDLERLDRALYGEGRRRRAAAGGGR